MRVPRSIRRTLGGGSRRQRRGRRCLASAKPRRAGRWDEAKVHDPATTVSFVSQFVTLMPGDLIFTGTPGTTKPMKPGDVVEVEIDGIGVLRNRVVAS